MSLKWIWTRIKKRKKKTLFKIKLKLTQTTTISMTSCAFSSGCRLVTWEATSKPLTTSTSDWCKKKAHTQQSNCSYLDFTIIIHGKRWRKYISYICITTIVQQFLNTVLDHVINNVGESKGRELCIYMSLPKEIVHKMVIDVLRRAFTELDAEEDSSRKHE